VRVGGLPVLRLLISSTVSLALLLLSVAPGLAVPPPQGTFEERVLEVIRNHPSAIVEALERYEQEQQKEQRAKQSALIGLLFPVPDQIIGGSPVLGKAGDELLVVFSDFQCPYCAEAQHSLQILQTQKGKGLRLVYKHFPLTQIHPQALPAARAAWAAGLQGKFWEFHDALFSNQAKLGEDLYQQIAQNLGLNLERFTKDRKGEASLQAIGQDLALAERLALQGTPTFLLQRGATLNVISLNDLQSSVLGRAQAP
jgi:protein-disulfide isomerase